MTSLDNSLAGLSLLTGANFAGMATFTPVESRAVRLAKAQFTAKPVVPVWSQGVAAPNLSAVLRRASLIDLADGAGRSPDVANAFTAYKALERLKALADAGARGVADSAALQKKFKAGLAEVERWMAAAPSDQLTLSFGKALRKADSVALPDAPAEDVRGSIAARTRDEALAGLTGTERFTLRVSRPGASDTLTVDLSSIAQPPTLDGVAAAFNTALASLPMTGADGAPVLSSDGSVVPRYQSRFAVVRHDGGGWGLELRSGGIEEVALRDEGAAPALLVGVAQGAEAGVGVPIALSRLTGATLDRATLTKLTAIDRDATALQSPPTTEGLEASPVLAPLTIAATVAAPDGGSYAIGTSRGTMGALVSDGEDELVLMKLDSRGQTLWQRALGTAGAASGLSVALAADGDVVVGGTVTPTGGDRDLLFARFGADGEEKVQSAVRQLGEQDFAGMAVLDDGSTLFASKAADGAISLVRVGADGKIGERIGLGVDIRNLRGMATAPNGDLVLLHQSGEDSVVSRFAGGDPAAAPTSERLTGVVASSLAIAGDGTVAVGGKRGSDAAVALIGVGATRWVDLASAGDDRIDQLAFDGGTLVAAGRTTGDLGGARTGLTDAFVARIDAASAAVEQVRQWGQVGQRSGAVTVSVVASGDSAVHRLGFSEGTINPSQSASLADVTALNPGDRFQIRINKQAPKTVTVEEGETASSFVERLQRLIGRSAGKVTITRSGGAPQIRIEPAAGQRLDLLPGPEGRDALAKLDLAPGSLIAAPLFDAKAPRVKPGGHYGLDLTDGLSVADKASAKVALERIDNAIATVRAGFRSLFWDATKAALAEGPRKVGSVSPYLAGQLARYTDALKRMGG
jgi:hypothetical protein